MTGLVHRFAWFRLTAVIAGASFLTWLSVAIGIAAIAQDRNPGLALAFAPFDARSRGAKAYELLQGDVSAADIAKVRRLAKGALARDPTVVSAARSLGLAADIEGDQARARRLLAYAEKLSRRDLATQLWLIEESVDRNDVVGALDHFDKALRTSRVAQPLLIPVLVSATEDPAILPPLLDVLASEPHWENGFLIHLINDGTSPVNVSAVVMKAGNRERRTQLLGRLEEQGEYALAWSVYRALEPTTPGLLRNGDFGKASRFPPFDWTFANLDDVIAGRGTVEGMGDETVLSFRSDSEAPVEVARQLLHLAPGRHHLSARAGGRAESSSRPAFWTITCASAPERPLGRSERAAADLEFIVPRSGCGWQWLRLWVPAKDGRDPVAGWVDDVGIVSRGSGAS